MAALYATLCCIHGCEALHLASSTTPDPEGNFWVSCSEIAPTPSPCSPQAYKICGGPADVLGAPQPLVTGADRSLRSYEYTANYHCR